MAVFDRHGYPVNADTVLVAYRERCFPMCDDRDGALGWFRPDERAVISWDRFKVPRSLAKTARQQPYRLTIDRAFAAVIAACADRDETWIGRDIEQLYLELHGRGIAHSIEAWRDDDLVGGLYGLAIGGVFCGESMFHRADNAAKLCVLHLVEHLQARGFVLLDCQQQTPHMQRFGAYEISDAEYATILTEAADSRDW